MKTNKSIFECYEKQLHAIVNVAFFEQLEKVGKETKGELVRWYNNYKSANGAELVAFDASKTDLQSAFANYTIAKSAYESEFAKVVNNTACSVPTTTGTNDVVKGWNIDTNDNTTAYNTANDMLKGMIAKVAELTENSLFTAENITAAGLSLDETTHLTFKDIGIYVSTLYSEFKKASKIVTADNNAFKTVCGLVDSSFVVSLRFVPEDRVSEAKVTIISEYLAKEDYTTNVRAKVWEHYGFADKAADIRTAATKVESTAKVDYKGKVHLLIQAISDTTDRKNFKFGQLKHLYELSGYPLQPTK